MAINTPMKSYLQLLVPLDRRCQWYRQLKSILGKMQDGGFHITVAFINDELDKQGMEKVADVLDQELRHAVAPVITFDKLDVFTSESGDKHIVNLTASVVPKEFTIIKERVRTRLAREGFKLGPFKLHVTLARVNTDKIDLQTLQNRICPVSVPPITRTLKDASYCYLKGYKHPIRRWTLS